MPGFTWHHPRFVYFGPQGGGTGDVHWSEAVLDYDEKCAVPATFYQQAL